MVRLKEYSPAAVLSLSIISIPYGAIKSRLARSKALSDNLISIPYGAIKR